MYTLGQRYNKVIQYNLTTGFDISTASFSQVKSVNTTARTPQGIAFNNDGSKMFIATRTYSKVVENTLS